MNHSEPYQQPVPTLRWWLPGTALVLTVLLVGCGTAPTREEVTPVLPAGFSDTGEEAAAEKWWHDLDDPQLDRLMEEALTGNLSLSAAHARLNQAEATARREGSDRIPDLDATASAERERIDSQDATESYTVGLAASYEVDLWGRVRAEHDAAALDAEASRADLRAAAITLSAQVARTWYSRVEARARLDLLDEQLHTARQNLELVERRFRTGHAPAADRHRQRRTIEGLEGERARAAARLATIDHELAVLLGQPATDYQAPEGELPEPAALPATGLPAELIQQRPDIQAHFHRLQAADARTAAAVANRFPRLNLTAALTSPAASTGDLMSTWVTTLGADLALPLFDGGGRRAEVERSRAATDEAVLDYAEAVLEAVAEVEDALVRERHQRVYLTRLEAQVAEAEELLDLTRRRYRHGDADHLAVLDAEEGLLDARGLLLEARREALEYRIDLHRALAGGWRGMTDAPADPLAALSGPGDASDTED